MIPGLERAQRVTLKLHYAEGLLIPLPLIARSPPKKRFPKKKADAPAPVTGPEYVEGPRISLEPLRPDLELGGLTLVNAFTKRHEHSGMIECISRMLFVRDDCFPDEDHSKLIAEYDEFVKGRTWKISFFFDEERAGFHIESRLPKSDHFASPNLPSLHAVA